MISGAQNNCLSEAASRYIQVFLFVCFKLVPFIKTVACDRGVSESMCLCIIFKAVVDLEVYML